MRLSLFFLASSLLGDVAVSALIAPPAPELATPRSAHQNTERDETSHEELWKRKGGGGGGGRGGGGSSGGSRGGGTSSGSGSSGRGSSSSNAGGRTTTGSGPPAVYGGGRFYGGGAVAPYRSGNRSPSGILPVFLAVGFLAFWPGVWLYGAHLYNYNQPYSFYNQTAQRNDTKPVTCACDPYLVCGCDENRDQQYLTDLIGNGSYAALNKTLINVADVNGTSTILLNGTLPNGTTAAGGEEDPFASGAAGAGLRAMLQHAGWWPVVVAVCTIALTA
ncbi:hypothetical protein N658DRAFT_492162 [Parathielavia hyrcaniae]|uniref:DUF7732 domain-containing protein n=1 Tax=Parathielavia hyrcaniae TaxID=113614 RepID=A0AAN6QBE8_9PEZI|nr:hypothetical protein N658DRAFT_492162 [Parathielavia hyrcaniae]